MKRVVSLILFLCLFLALSPVETAQAAGNPFDKQDNREVPYTGGLYFGLDASETSNASIKPSLSVSRLEYYYSSSLPGSIVSISLSLSGAGVANHWAPLGLHIGYDTRLTFNGYDRSALPSSMSVSVIEPSNNRGVIGFCTAASSDCGPAGEVLTLRFVLPSDAQEGDLYPIGIFYQSGDLFTNVDQDSAGNEMQSWLFYKGISNGYIAIKGAPVITKQPQDVTATELSPVTFSVTAENAESYQWQESPDSVHWYDISGATQASYTFTCRGSNKKYRCIVSNSNGSVTSSEATLTTILIITSVDVTITAPAAGAKPDYDPVIPSAHYYSDSSWSSDTSRNGVMWFDKTAERYLNTTDTFITGHIYSVRMDFYPRSGYEFYSDIYGEINGKTASADLRSGEDCDYLRLSYTFPALPGKPVITTQPTSKTVNEGKTATFKVVATGATSYQWQYKKPGDTSWTKVSKNGTSATYSLTTEARHDGYKYRCRVTNAAGTVNSSTVTLTVKPKPVITTQPASKTVNEGKTATFKVVATGATGYKWQYLKPGTSTWTDVSKNGTSATYSLTTEARHNGYKYRCKVTNAAGTVTSSTATLTVKPKPVITTQPASRTVNEGKTATFKVVATGATGYKWQYLKPGTSTWTDVSTNGTSATYSLTTEARHNGYKYRCKVSNAAGTVTSSTATLTVKPKPVITTQPTSKTVTAGSKATFKVVATGATGYQWQYRKPGETTWNDVTVNGTSATYSLTTAARHNGYKYRCKVSNAAGTVISSTVTLTVK